MYSHAINNLNKRIGQNVMYTDSIKPMDRMLKFHTLNSPMNGLYPRKMLLFYLKVPKISKDMTVIDINSQNLSLKHGSTY